MPLFGRDDEVEAFCSSNVVMMATWPSGVDYRTRGVTYCINDDKYYGDLEGGDRCTGEGLKLLMPDDVVLILIVSAHNCSCFFTQTMSVIPVGSVFTHTHRYTRFTHTHGWWSWTNS